MTIYARYIPVHVYTILKYQMKNNNENKILNEINLEFWYSMIAQSHNHCGCSELQRYYCLQARLQPQAVVTCGCSRLDQYCCSKSEKFCSSYLYVSEKPFESIYNTRCAWIQHSSINVIAIGRFFSETIRESKKKTIQEIRYAKQSCIMCVLEAIYNDSLELNILYHNIKYLKRKRKRNEEQNLELVSKLKLIEDKHQLILKKKKIFLRY